MEHISTSIMSVLETLEPPTKSGSGNTETSAKLRQPASLTETQITSPFDAFKTCGDAQLERMRDAAIQFCRDMASSSVRAYWLVLLGSSGAGKTMLTKAISAFFNRHLDLLIDETVPGTSEGRAAYRRRGGFLSWERCCRKMIEDFDFGFVPQASDDWLVCLDDIGTEYERQKELSTSKLFSILCGRERRWTVITANLSIDAIQSRLDTRIASRMLRHGAVVIDVDVPDFNLR
jgi:DNA replication protein DnaC